MSLSAIKIMVLIKVNEFKNGNNNVEAKSNLILIALLKIMIGCTLSVFGNPSRQG
jgi:hypothetical protein